MKVSVSRKLIFIDDGSLNANDNVYPAGSVKLNKNPLPVFYNFDPKFKIGDGYITRDKDQNDHIHVDMKLYPKTQRDAEKVLQHFSGTFPAIRGVLLPDEKDKKKIGGLEIQSIGLCTQPNSDPKIQPILLTDLSIIEEKPVEETPEEKKSEEE